MPPPRPWAAGIGEHLRGDARLFGKGVADLLVHVGRGVLRQHHGEAGPVEGIVRAAAEVPAAGAQRNLVTLHGARGYEIIQDALDAAYFLEQLPG